MDKALKELEGNKRRLALIEASKERKLIQWAKENGYVRLSDVRLNDWAIKDLINKYILEHGLHIGMSYGVASALASKSSELLTVEEK